jgi:tetratricopeptide (TPR) repeat protein
VAKKALEKELKKPDEFVSFWTHLGAKIVAHRRKVIAGVVTVAVGIGAGWGIVSYQAAHAAKATAAFARIERIASAELLPEKADDKEASAAVAAAGEDQVPRFKTEKERLEAAIKEADAFVAAFGSEGLGRRALLGKAGRLVAVEKAAEAATLYETLAGGEQDASLRAVAQAGAAAAYEAAGKFEEALRSYTSLAESSGGSGFYLDHALYAKARLLEKQGKTKDAEQVLRDILTKAPKTLLRQQIDDRLAVLTEK